MDQSKKQSKDKNINEKVIFHIMFWSMILFILVITFISCIRIYYSKREKILDLMASESRLVSIVVSDNFNNAENYLYTMARWIVHGNKDKKKISNIFHIHSYYKSIKVLGWRKYSWIDENSMINVDSVSGILDKPLYIDFPKDYEGEVLFQKSERYSKADNIRMIYKLYTHKSQYMGAIMMSYDIDVLVNRINKIKKSYNTNFIIIDKNLNIIAQSKLNIDGVINAKEKFANHLLKKLKSIDFAKLNPEGECYLDMFSGNNYFISPVYNADHFIIVNIDNKAIRDEIIDSISDRLVDICIFAFLCIMLILFIFRMEFILRSKADAAFRIANDANTAKSNFLFFTAHEIRSPLGFIMTSADVMKKNLMGKLPTHYAEYVDGIYDSSKEILEFVNNILDESKMVNGRFKIVKTIVNIEEVINISISEVAIRYKNAEISYDLDRNLPYLICDKQRIQQVLNNLIINGIKYSKQNPKVKIEAKVIRGHQIEIAVRDNGIGMSQKDIEYALNSNYNLSTKYSYEEDSYGLGLTIVKMLLESHNAKLSIKSTLGVGTTIYIRFPKYQSIYKAKKNNANS